MKILSIETSCDETAVSVIEARGEFPDATYTIRGNALFSQIDIHREFGGVFPTVAKREHVKIITPLFEKALKESGLLQRKADEDTTDIDTTHLTEILHRESDLVAALTEFCNTYKRPDIDLIAVTVGPGLEPTLWVGINFARALATLFDIPVVPVNHMEGHVLASLFTDNTRIANPGFPTLALLISGGHTEFALMHNWHDYERIGRTRDDAVGEAFDKVARLLELPYPGGPEISKRADDARTRDLPLFTPLPRPMLDSGDLDLSFSGLKTAVRYAVHGKTLTDDERASVAREFEDAVTEVLIAKTKRAIDEHGVQSLIIGGGVSANRYIRQQFQTVFKTEYPDLAIHVPESSLATDNSIMIGLAGHARADRALTPSETDSLRASGAYTLS